jgi:hypothetical protein
MTPEGSEMDPNWADLAAPERGERASQVRLKEGVRLAKLLMRKG